MNSKVRMFYGGLSTDFSTAYVEKCFELVAAEEIKPRICADERESETDRITQLRSFISFDQIRESLR